ncbi:MAG: response regulator [Chloroflexi bacterium]|nr:response regulator [Chloroflexota bacterium]
MTGAKLSVLILEPNVLQCDLIKLALIRNSMHPIICENSGTIRQQLVEHLPDLLLVDTHLPGQNGLDLVTELNAEAFLSRTKVFIISSLGYPEIVQKAVKAGASDFLVKPLDTDLLVTRILRCFNQPAKG